MKYTIKTLKEAIKKNKNLELVEEIKVSSESDASFIVKGFGHTWDIQLDSGDGSLCLSGIDTADFFVDGIKSFGEIIQAMDYITNA